jgi:hypothetical protein
VLHPRVKDSYAEISRWSMVDAAIMHEFLDQIDAQAAPERGNG